VDGRPACFDGTDWRWAADGEEADGVVVAGEGFARCELRSSRTPVGPSIGPRAAAFWRFADEAMGTAIGALTAPPDVTRA
jgi:hypothetical protein